MPGGITLTFILIGLALGLVLFGVILGWWWHHSKHSGDLSSHKRDGGLIVSGHVLKDERLQSDFILGAIEDGVIMVDPKGSIHLFNPAASKITGWPAEEAVGLEYKIVLQLVDDHNTAVPAEMHPFAQALASHQTVRDSKYLLTTKAGKRLPVSLIISPVNDSSGKPGGNVIAVLRDITKEKAEEAQRTEFISTASHEMRTPIAAIEGYLSLALNDKVAKVDDNARNLLVKAHTSTQQLGQLFQDLLTSSKAEDGRLTSNPTATEVGELVEQVADNARFNAQKKGLSLKYLLSNNESANGKVIRPLFYSYVDPNRLREVLQNIIDNALKYTLTGSVTIALTGDPSVVQIQVRDTGQGISAEDIPHLFEKFYRVDSTLTRTVGGTGLGLFISRKIIELYNGRLWVESEVGKGSTFFINLPRLTATQALEVQKQQAGQMSPLGPV